MRLPDIDLRPQNRRLLAWAVALSLVIHAISLWDWQPRVRPLERVGELAGDASTPLVARLTPPPSSARAVPQLLPELRTPPSRSRPPASARRPIPSPPIIAVEPRPERIEPLPRVAPPAVAPPPDIRPRRTPIESDLSAYIAARRRERGDSPGPAEAGSTRGPATAAEESERRDRAIQRNLASLNQPSFGDAPRNSGGIFQITRLGYDDAEFTFFGWNRDIKRRTTQRIEVRRGDAEDIRVAVVRRMIAIIREYEQEDFVWRSLRLGRDVELSARLADDPGLEAFMMREFFERDAPRANPSG